MSNIIAPPNARSQQFKVLRSRSPQGTVTAAALLAVISTFVLYTIYATCAASSISLVPLLASMLAAINSLLGLALSLKKRLPLFLVTFYFCIVFFVIAPLQQLVHGFDVLIADQNVSLIAFVLCDLFTLICLGFCIASADHSSERLKPPLEIVASGRLLFAIVFISLSCSAFQIVSYGGAIVSNRHDISSTLGEQFDSASLVLITGFVAPLSFYGALFALWSAWHTRRFKTWTVLCFLTTLLALFTNNPSVSSRNQFAAFLFAAIFLFIGRRRCTIMLATLIAGTFASVLFQAFRSAYTTVDVPPLDEFFSKMDYDAFSLVCHTVYHVNMVGLDYGYNILSSILFFVPRNIWPGKGQATPFYMLDTLKIYRDLWSSNLSEPIVAEGYFAFGLPGAAAISFAYAALVYWLDSWKSRSTFTYVFACACPILLVMLIRGSLIVALSALMAHFVALYLICFLMRPGRQAKNHIPQLSYVT